MTTDLVGYTLGNPEAYERALDAGPVYKQVGGAWFATFAAAAAALENGYLPACWFPGLALPGRVYRVVGGAHDESVDEVGASCLTEPARVERVAGACP